MIAADAATAEAGQVRLRDLLLTPAVGVVAAVGMLLRIWVLLSPQGMMNADEAYTGLQAADIARGHLPVVIGGAAYTGTTDTYLLAPIVWLTGQHVVTLKLMSPVLWAVAAVLAVGAARRLLGARSALLAGGLVWIAPGALGVLATRAYVAYAFGLVVVFATIWAALAVVDRPEAEWRSSGVFGALAGLAFYTHPMFAGVAVPLAAVVGARHRTDIRRFWGPAVAAAVAVNVPFLAWNVKNGWASLEQPPNDAGSTYLDRLRGFFTGLLPRDLGVRRLGATGEWVLVRPLGVLVVIAVLAAAVFGVVRLARSEPWRAAVIGVPLAIVWLFLAGLSNLAFVADGRYGVVAFPVLVLALVAAFDGVARRLPPWGWAVPAAAWLVVCVVPFLHTEAGTELGDPNRRTQALVDAFEEAGFDRVAGNYWAVLPIEYQSDARIRVAVAGNPFSVRLAETQRLVEATPPERLAYVFDPGPIDPTWVKLPIERYRQVEVAGYILYFPT